MQKIDSMKKNWKDFFLNKIVTGNSFELLQKIPNNEIDLIITSPPYYEQRIYKGIGNEDSVEDYIENLCKIFHECVRITKITGSIVFNVGDRYNDKGLDLIPYKFAIEIQRRESVKLVNEITWIKSNPTPRQFKKRLVNSTEPFFHFVTDPDKYYYNLNMFLASNDLKRNINKKKREDSEKGESYFKLIEKSSLSDRQKKLARDELSKNIRDYKDGKIDDFRMKIKGIHALPFGGQEGGRMTHLRKKGFTIIKMNNNKMKKDYIKCSVETIKERKHPAIYPEFIIKEFIKLLTKKEDIVLDPFIGSGTTGVAAKRLNRQYIGIDINSEFCNSARKRIKEVNYNPELFEKYI